MRFDGYTREDEAEEVTVVWTCEKGEGWGRFTEGVGNKSSWSGKTKTNMKWSQTWKSWVLVKSLLRTEQAGGESSQSPTPYEKGKRGL